MRLALLVLLAAVAGGSSYASTTKTQVVRWSPFDSSGQVKKTLTIKRIRAVGSCGDIGPGSEVVGDFGYRCGFGNVLADPCWRDGARRTDFIVCAGNPWARSVDLVRVPHLMLHVGVTFGAAPTYPWGIQLTSGDRCTAFQGAHDSIVLPGGRRLTVDYYCSSGIVLLRDLRRAKALWTIDSARYDDKHHRYRRLGRVTVDRVVLSGLPPAMLRQHEIAHGAALAAIAFVRPLATRQHPDSHLHVFRVRLALPAGDWANVHVWDDRGTPGDWRVVLHRVGGRWIQVKSFETYCVKLPAPIRQQLFDARDCVR